MTDRWARLVQGRSGRVLNIGHRGARAFAPENTREAIEKAARLGADLVELDVRLSRDGQAVVVHDEDLSRCSDVVRKFPDRQPPVLSAFTAAELAQLDAGSWYIEELERPASNRQSFLKDLTDADRISCITASDLAWYRSGAVRIPTLAECLAVAARLQLLVNLEIKSRLGGDSPIVATVVEAIKAAGLEERALVSSFDHRQLAAVRRMTRTVATGALTRDRLYDAAEYVRRLLDGDAYHPGASVQTNAKGLGATDDCAMVAEVRAGGIAVNIWTINEPADMKALVDAGVTGIFTDYPNRLAAVLAEVR